MKKKFKKSRTNLNLFNSNKLSYVKNCVNISKSPCKLRPNSLSFYSTILSAFLLIIIVIIDDPIDGSITQEDANLTLTTSAIMNLTSTLNNRNQQQHLNNNHHHGNNHHHHPHNTNHLHNLSMINSNSSSSTTTTLKSINDNMDDESLINLPLLPSSESSSPTLSLDNNNGGNDNNKNNPKGLRFEEEPIDSYIVRGKSTILRCRTLNALNAWFTCNSGDERRIQSNQKISNYVDPQTGIRLIEIDLEITRNDVEEHHNSGYTNSYQCWCTAYGGHHQIMSRKASVSFAYLKKHFHLEPKSIRLSYDDIVGNNGKSSSSASSSSSSSLTQIKFECQPPVGVPKPIVFWMRNDTIILESEHQHNEQLNNDKEQPAPAMNKPKSSQQKIKLLKNEKFLRRKKNFSKKFVIKTSNNQTYNLTKRMANLPKNTKPVEDYDDDDDYLDDEDDDDDDDLEFDASKDSEHDFNSNNDDDGDEDDDRSSLIPDHFDLAALQNFHNPINTISTNNDDINSLKNIPINYHMADDYSLVIKNVQLNDQANYTCGAYNVAGVRFSKPATLTIFVNGQWSNWGSWSPCQLSSSLLSQGIKCGIGTQKRIRHCNNPAPSNNGQFCPGESIQITECTILCPPIDGFWSPWSQWSICSHECTQIRRRICNNPIPLYGGNECFGSDFAIKNCTGGLCHKNFDPTNFIQSIGSSSTSTTTTTTLQQQSNDQLYFIIIFILILIILTFVIYLILKFQFQRRRNVTKSTESAHHYNPHSAASMQHSWLNSSGGIGGNDSDHHSHSLSVLDNDDSSLQQSSLTPTLLLLQQSQDGRFYNKTVKSNYNHYPMEPILNKQQQQQSVPTTATTPQKMMIVSRLNNQQSSNTLDHFLLPPNSGSSLQSTPIQHSKAHPLPTIPRDDDTISFRSGESSANRYEEPQFPSHINHHHHSPFIQPILKRNVGSPHNNGASNAGTNSSSASANTAITTTANEMSQNESEPDYAEPIINDGSDQHMNAIIRPPSLNTAPPIMHNKNTNNVRPSSEESSSYGSNNSNNIGSLCGRHEKFLKINHELTHYGYYSSLPNLGVGLYLPPEFMKLPSSSNTYKINDDSNTSELYIRYGIDTHARYPGLCSLSSVITLNLSRQQQQQQTQQIEFDRPVILIFRHCLSFNNNNNQQQQQPNEIIYKKNLVIMWRNPKDNSSKSSKWIELIHLDDQQQQQQQESSNCYAFLDQNHVYLITNLFGQFMFCYKHNFSQYGTTTTSSSTNSSSSTNIIESSFDSMGRSMKNRNNIVDNNNTALIMSKMVNFSITIEHCNQTEHLIKCFVYDNLPASILMFQNDQLPSNTNDEGDEILFGEISSSSSMNTSKNKLIQVLIGRMSNPLLMMNAYNSAAKISLPPNRSSSLCFELLQPTATTTTTASNSRINNIGSTINPRMEIPLEHLCSLGPNSMLHCSFMVPNNNSANNINGDLNFSIMNDNEDIVDFDYDENDYDDYSDDDDSNESYDSVNLSPTYENKILQQPQPPSSYRRKALLKKRNRHRNFNYEIRVWQQKPPEQLSRKHRFNHHHNHNHQHSNNAITLNRLNMRQLNRLSFNNNNNNNNVHQYFHHEQCCRLFSDNELRLRKTLAEHFDHHHHHQQFCGNNLYNNERNTNNVLWKQWAKKLPFWNSADANNFDCFEQQLSPSLQLMELWESKTINELMITMIDDEMMMMKKQLNKDDNKMNSIQQSINHQHQHQQNIKIKQLFYSKLLHQIQQLNNDDNDDDAGEGGNNNNSNIIDLILGHQF